MELSNTAIALLSHIEQPAFCVQDGMVVGTNAAAEQRQILRSADAHEYIANLETLADGSCTVTSAGSVYQATANRIDETLLVILEADNTQAQLQSLALAANHIRTPLSNIMAMTDMLLKNDDLRKSDEVLAQTVRINRRLNQIQRMICDMSDTWQYSNWHNIRKTAVNITAVFSEVMEKATATLAEANIHLHYTGIDAPLTCLADVQMLERAIYNLISNSIKFSDGESSIQAQLSVSGNMLYFSVMDSGSRTPASLQRTLFSRFLREPGLEEDIFGIGLGMMLIRSVAIAHGGTILIDHPEENCNRVTMTLEIRDSDIATPILSVTDYAGGRDHALLELSDILPPEMYDPKKH